MARSGRPDICPSLRQPQRFLQPSTHTPCSSQCEYDLPDNISVEQATKAETRRIVKRRLGLSPCITRAIGNSVEAASLLKRGCSEVTSRLCRGRTWRDEAIPPTRRFTLRISPPRRTQCPKVQDTTLGRLPVLLQQGTLSQRVPSLF